MRVVLLARVRALSWKLDIRDALVKLSHDVTVVDDLSPASAVREACDGADALLWARTHSRTPAGDIRGALRDIERAGVRTAGVHFDLYRGIAKRRHEIGVHPWWSCQTVWTPDGDPAPWPRGVHHRWLPPAIGDAHVGRGTVSTVGGVVFTGSGRYHSEHPWRRDMLEFLRHAYGSDFRHYGPRAPLGPVYGDALTDLYSSAAVVVGDACLAGQVHGYWSDRLPITLGRGGLLVHPRVPGMTEQGYVDGATLLTFRPDNLADLRRTIDRALVADRDAIVDRAVAITRQWHLMSHRMTTILEAM